MTVLFIAFVSLAAKMINAIGSVTVLFFSMDTKTAALDSPDLKASVVFTLYFATQFRS